MGWYFRPFACWLVAVLPRVPANIGPCSVGNEQCRLCSLFVFKSRPHFTNWGLGPMVLIQVATLAQQVSARKRAASTCTDVQWRLLAAFQEGYPSMRSICLLQLQGCCF